MTGIFMMLGMVLLANGLIYGTIHYRDDVSCLKDGVSAVLGILCFVVVICSAAFGTETEEVKNTYAICSVDGEYLKSGKVEEQHMYMTYTGKSYVPHYSSTEKSVYTVYVKNGDSYEAKQFNSASVVMLKEGEVPYMEELVITTRWLGIPMNIKSSARVHLPQEKNVGGEL